MVKIMQRNLHLGYGYTALAYFGITSLWVIFLQQRGLSLVQIGLCESVFHLTSLFSEVPSGMLADRFGYKAILIGGRVAAIAHALIMLMATNFWWFALGFVLQAWAYNLQSGTIEALLYDSLAENHATERFPVVTKNMNMVIESATPVGVLLAGGFVHGHLSVTYLLYMASAIVAIGCIIGLYEPLRDQATVITGTQSLSAILRAAGKCLRQLPQLRQLMVFHAAFSALGMTYYYDFQAVMTAKGFSGPLISGILIATAILNVGGVQLTPWLQQRWALVRLLRGLTVLLASVLISALWANTLGLVLGYLLVNLLLAIVEPVLSNYYNRLLPSAQRATLLSVSSMIFSLMMVVLFPVMGWLIEWSSFTVVFGGTGMVVLVCGWLVFRRQ
ncbi:MFS transporter [Levilactobacillus brevis]|uniref:MFS transporter n=2 Tax=Levilactobacillus brevis TaxID=1580 RepID=UPI000A206F53|nr:MFS transporter [Levilactobacillus brevis]ARN96766.1 MFS transporter [Levilactobacillus brevis]